MALEVMGPRINTWGLGTQKPTSTSSCSVDPNLGDVPSNEIQSVLGKLVATTHPPRFGAIGLGANNLLGPFGREYTR